MNEDCFIESEQAPPAKWILLLAELRAPFFTASVAPVLLGTALAFYQTGMWHWPLFLWTLAGMVLIHAGANVANDYFDHLSGNDKINVDYVRPFTGGSRMIQRGLLSPREVLCLSLICFAMGSAIGVYLSVRVGAFVLLLGVIGVAGGFFYTAPPLNLTSRAVGELVIAVNFGILPVLGVYYVQTKSFSWDAVILSLPVAFLIAAILFINQFQDFRADRAVGKRNWVVRLGRARSVWVYRLLMTLWTVPIIAAVLLKICPTLCLIALVPAIPAIKAIAIAGRHFDHPHELAPANALTVMIHLAVGVLLAVALIAASFLRTT